MPTGGKERRLFFVGMTRARNRLILTHARRRFRRKVRPSTPSPFLADVEKRLLAHHRHRAHKKPARPDPQRTLFEC
jgi:DNA helicase-2/ATP-dependent DNA helicase PcrA